MKEVSLSEEEKKKIFTEITSATHDWMLNQYPSFDSELVDKIKELRKIQSEIKVSFENHLNIIKTEKDRYTEQTIDNINNFLKKDYPDINKSLEHEVKQFKGVLKKHEFNEEQIERKLKDIIHNQSIYEDVYKLRDEFKDIQKFMNDFKKKVKKAFEV